MKRTLPIVAMVLTLMVIGGIFTLQSQWFANKLERRLVQEISRATGASVRIGEFSINWKTLRFRAAPFTLHGTEPAGARPLLQASEVEVGLSLRSFLNRSVDIVLLRVAKPTVHLIIHADGTTNIPGGGGGLSATETLINLAVGHFEMKDGIAILNEQKIPFDIDADGIQANLVFDPEHKLYQGNIEIGRLLKGQQVIRLESTFSFGTNRADIRGLRMATRKSSVEGSGWFENWSAMNGELNLKVQANVPEVAQWLDVSSIDTGMAAGDIQGKLKPGEGWEWTGPVRASDISFTIADKKFSNVSGKADLLSQGNRTSFQNLEARLQEGTFSGSAEIQPSRYHIKGELKDVHTFDPLSAALHGPIEIEGNQQALQTLSGKLTLTPLPGKIPVGGFVSAQYAAQQEQLIFESSLLRLGESEVKLEGSLQRQLQVELHTRNLKELLPAAQFLNSSIPSEFDVSLENGWATIQATVTGSTRKPILSGKAQFDRFRTMGEILENVSTRFEANESLLRLTDTTLNQRGAKLSGAFEIELQQWQIKDQNQLYGKAQFQGATLESFLSPDHQSSSSDLPVKGIASGQVQISGTVGKPHAMGDLNVTQSKIFQETLDRVTARFSGNKTEVLLTEIRALQGTSLLQGTGKWIPGNIDFNLHTSNWSFTDHFPGKIPAIAAGSLQGKLTETSTGWSFASLDGTLKTTIKDQGDVHLTATTSNQTLNLQAKGNLQGAVIQSDSSWKLTGKMPGSGSIRITQLTPEILHRLTITEDPLTEFPLQGKIEGTIAFQGNLQEPELFTGRAVFPQVVLAPKRDGGQAVADLTIRNEGDVVLIANQQGIVVERGLFRAKDTELEASGTLSFRRANTWNLLIRGNINLAAISTFRPDLIAAGSATLNTRIRGTFDNPDVEGRMSFNNASFSLREIPNGLDKVTGTILFDRTRANIESFSAESGGGNVALSGYIGFGGDLTYQLGAQLNQVRVRYPEGVSSQSNATLTLTGSSRRSLLSGTVTVLRAGLTPQTDASNMMGRSSRSLSSVPTGEFLRGLQFDMRIETSQSTEISTQLTKNIQADAELRLRGTPARPILLGRASVTQGEVQFFGTDYKINRGEITFVNPVTIEPRIDMDLETRVRGITVSINFSGPLNKLNMSYRSDPPLQSSEILALLAVGRTPTAATALGVGTINGQGLLSGGAGGGNAILNSALTTPSNSNLQRFFGVTRLKIDPQLIGMDNTPQARMTLEQPISRDVTVTYVQMLSRAQGQMVRVQWDLSREWSALATRDENGVLSVDFIFKRSFK